MKRTLMLLLLLFLTINCQLSTINSQTLKREFRATWVTTVSSLDWPKTKVTTTGNATQINAQKREWDTFLDQAEAAGLNALCLQVRGAGDAIWPSQILPWSNCLTGTRGKNPGYDPLAYAIQTAHARGIEIHAWLNPYRHETTATHFTNDPIRQNHPDWLLQYNSSSFSGTILDPGNPEVRNHIYAIISELVENYDLDGIIFDDYFYGYGGTPNELDAASRAQYKPASMSISDWRRQNVNTMVQGVYNTIAASSRPWVRFGIGPFGIWTTSASVAQSYGLTNPSGLTGSNPYETLYCNTVEWMKQGYVDYVAPQIYWSSTTAGHGYDMLCPWWSNVAKIMSDQLPGTKQVHMWPAMAIYQGWMTLDELSTEIGYNRESDRLDAPGCIMFRQAFLRDDMRTQLSGNEFTSAALPPAMHWKQTASLEAPTHLTLTSGTLSWTGTADRYTVYAFPAYMTPEAAMTDPQYLVAVVYGKSLNVSNISGYATCKWAVVTYDRYGMEHAYSVLLPGGGTQDDPCPVNPYGWTSAQDMYAALNADYNAAYSLTATWKPIAQCATINEGMPISTYQDGGNLLAFMQGREKWQWLLTYMDKVCAEQSKTVASNSTTFTRFNVQAFFMNTAYTAYPSTADYSQAGVASEDAWCTYAGWRLTSSATDLSQPTPAPAAEKFFRGGTLLIRRGDALYTPTGQRVE